MKFLILFLSFLPLQSLTNTAFADAGFNFLCTKSKGNLPNVATALISGPVFQYDYRLTLRNALNKQVDSGQCDMGTLFRSCFIKDMYGNAAVSPTKLASRLSAKIDMNKSSLFEIEVQNTSGQALFVCRRI